MGLKTIGWDAADRLTAPDRIAAYLGAAIADGGPDLIRAALGDVARAIGMSEIAGATGLDITSFNPKFAMVVAVLRSLGLRLAVRTAA